MFSELCRETLRKAAVCYSSGRAGSPSPSPPTSPPPSPAKEAKTTANVDLANVRDTCHEARDPGTSGKRSLPQQPSSSAGTCTTEFRDFTGRRSPTASGDSREYVQQSGKESLSVAITDEFYTIGLMEILHAGGIRCTETTIIIVARLQISMHLQEIWENINNF
ncbi:unnamed protein product [Heterotrigona itama]|uniref:Uncharacterized protein n=1 Tax=Heterotrigona itama TaxID=395501 RepID=A0A6V7H947_9HYME|nr:unnamed protein product [Heterotrigona itama]